ncbi:MAG: tRNA 4-thiouridine(8) synthase ThiI [Candidatus Ratteibacteria bacterium]
MIKKAIGLISGGLDSILALKMIKEQGFEIIGVFIKTPFLSGFGEKTLKNLQKLSGEMGFELEIIDVEEDYIEIIKNPEYGYGENLNPCIDCHIYMLKKAKKIMEEKNGLFVFTGEILGQRGKSQNLNALKIIEEKSSLKGKLLRPLTALNLPPTEVEEKGIVDRNLLLGIKGRGRKMQLYLAQTKNLKYFQTPSGGCLLTNSSFCKRLQDLFINSKNINLKDCYILQIGRHFRISPETKLIITRDEDEKKKIINFCNEDDFIIKGLKNFEIIGVVKGRIQDLIFEIFGGYIRSESDIISVENLKGEVFETRFIRKTNKLNYQKFLI